MMMQPASHRLSGMSPTMPAGGSIVVFGAFDPHLTPVRKQVDTRGIGQWRLIRAIRIHREELRSS